MHGYPGQGLEDGIQGPPPGPPPPPPMGSDPGFHPGIPGQELTPTGGDGFPGGPDGTSIYNMDSGHPETSAPVDHQAMSPSSPGLTRGDRAV